MKRYDIEAGVAIESPIGEFVRFEDVRVVMEKLLCVVDPYRTGGLPHQQRAIALARSVAEAEK